MVALFQKKKQKVFLDNDINNNKWSTFSKPNNPIVNKQQETEIFDMPVDPDVAVGLKTAIKEHTRDLLCELPDVFAEFPGGPLAKKSFMEENLRYPSFAERNNISRIVEVQFVVDTDGTIQDVKVLNPINFFGFDEEAVRVIKLMPRWTPGKQSGRPVRSRYIQTISFGESF